MSDNERKIVERIVEMVEAYGKPGPGGVDITGIIPSEVYIGIGRDSYDTEYEVAEATAESIIAGLASWIRMEFGIEKVK